MTNTKKIPCWLTILLLSGLGISVNPHQILTRTSEVSRALSPVMSSYEVVRMAPGEIERQVRTTGELRFRFNQTDFYFNLEPHDMRAPGYQAVATGPGGVRRTPPSHPVHTFKGVLAGREDTRGRFNLTDHGVEGVVYAPEGWYYVEPLRNYVPSAPAGELVVYKHADIKPSEGLKCGVSLPQRLQRGVDNVTVQLEASALTNYVFDVATEADFEYVQAQGGYENANREILGILNQVEGVYQSELLLQLRIVYQHTWGTEEDPYTATNTSDLLYEFAEHWNTHFAPNVDYDLAHLWTDRKRVDDGAVAGTAYLSVVCNSRYSSYGLSTHQISVPSKYITPAHEIGHNFGAVHPNEVNPPIAGCINTIMVVGQESANHGLTFCEFSRQEIANHVSFNNGCLSTQPITLQPPTLLTASADSMSRINLAWQDNSINETGFLVQRRWDRSPNWVQIGTTAANAETFSNDGLFAGATFFYRVQVVNDMEFSAFSNEAAATTLAGTLTWSNWRIDTIVGSKENIGDNGPAVHALLSKPEYVAVDGSGNVYVSDTGNHRVRRVDATGTIFTIAGTGERGFSGDGGPAAEARLSVPRGLAVDDSGNLYIADSGNHRIRRVDPSGNITTIAGTGQRGFSGDGGPAVTAQLTFPSGLTVDSSGNLYIADLRNHRIRRVNPSGTIITIAGTGERGFSGDGGLAVEAQLYNPRGLAVDGSGSLYIADGANHCIRRVDPSGTINTIAGTNQRGFGGDGSPAVEAELNSPVDVAVDRSGNLYIADSGNNRIRRVDPSGTIITIAGTGQSVLSYSGDGGPAVEAKIASPSGLAVDSSGNLYIADTYNHRIRRVDPSGIIITIAGVGASSYSGDGGPAITARLYRPGDVAVDSSGNLYIADTYNHRIRRVDPSGTISTIAGTGERGFGGDGGPAVEARLNYPSGVAVDDSGNLYIADVGNHRIRRVNSLGIINTIAGTGYEGYSGDGGPAVAAQLTYPGDLAIDGKGNLYFTDSNNNRVRQVNSSGIVTTVAGTGEKGFGGDGGPAIEALLDGPSGVAVDNENNLYVADTRNYRIRRIDNTRTITTIAGTGFGNFNGGDGPAIEAVLGAPYDLAIDKSGNLYIAVGHRIRLVNTAGIITTIAGPRGIDYFSGGYNRDSGLAVEVLLHTPSGVAVDGSGNVYIADTFNHRIRVLTRPPPPPSSLRATAVSSSRINLAWQDNSTNEKGFRVERRVAGTVDWVEIGTVATNLTTFLDEGLEPLITYHYRVRAFNDTASSTFSNDAVATTLKVMPPTVTQFIPTSGPVGTRVTLTGTHLFEATAVKFNEVDAPRFEVVSGTSIDVFVPSEAVSGPISVVAPGGKAVSTESFTVTTGIQSRLFVPIVLRSRGRTKGSYFTSELTLTNRGETMAAINYTYTASIGTGSGTAVDFLEAGRQRIIPDAIAYLTSLGVPIGEGVAGGTLKVDIPNLSSASDAAVTVRTATPVPLGEGRAGLAYVGLRPADLFMDSVILAGLRQNRQDRSNVAFQNMGTPEEGSMTLKTTVFSGEEDDTRSRDLGEVELEPGEFHQYSGLLGTLGSPAQGYVKVERVEGTGAFLRLRGHQ